MIYLNSEILHKTDTLNTHFSIKSDRRFGIRIKFGLENLRRCVFRVIYNRRTDGQTDKQN